jgi:hypothetical protein
MKQRRASSFKPMQTGIASAKGLEADAMKKVLVFAAVSEAATGMALLIVPSVVGRLLLGEELTGIAVAVARVTGIALIALGVACWPGRDAGGALRGMLSYSLLTTLYLGYLGIGGEWAGPLLWPAVVVHAVVTILFARAWFKDQQTKGKKASVVRQDLATGGD